MRHKKKGRKLGRKVGNRRALLMNLASQMITLKRIMTTDAKAKELRTYIEPLITLAKKNDLHSRRMIIRKLQKRILLIFYMMKLLHYMLIDQVDIQE